MATWEIYAGDLYPPLPLVIADSNGPMNLVPANISAINFAASSGAGGHTIAGAATNLYTSFTAGATINSPNLTSVSAFTNLWLPGTPPWATGSPLFSAGNLPAPTAGASPATWVMPTILSWNQGASTIVMSQNALVTGTITIIANLGFAEYVWGATDTQNTGLYNYVSTVVWLTGSKPQTFPSGGLAAPTLLIDAYP